MIKYHPVLLHSYGKWPMYRWFTLIYPLNMMLFHGVKLPEGISWHVHLTAAFWYATPCSAQECMHERKPCLGCPPACCLASTTLSLVITRRTHVSFRNSAAMHVCNYNMYKTSYLHYIIHINTYNKYVYVVSVSFSFRESDWAVLLQATCLKLLWICSMGHQRSQNMLLNSERTALQAIAACITYSLDFKSTKFWGYQPCLSPGWTPAVFSRQILELPSPKM